MSSALLTTNIVLLFWQMGARNVTPSRSRSASAVMSGLLSAENPPADAGTCAVKSETVSAAAPRMLKIGCIS